MNKPLVFIKHIAKLILKRETLNFERTYIEDKDSLVFFDNIDYEKLKIKNTNVYKNLISIDGPGFSGSSAFGDLLGEFSNCTSLGGVDLRENPERGADNAYEIDFFREPNGIYDLEKICFTNVGRIRDEAIHQFIRICKKYYHSGISIYDDYFYNLSKLFVKNITDFTIKTSEKSVTYVPKKLSVKEYRAYAKEFLTSFIKNIPSKENLILDNIMSISKPDIDTLYDYFGDFKLLYILSDPRDIYTRARLAPGNDWVPVNPEIFVRSWNRVVPEYKNSKNKSLLCLSFDELCNNYDSVLNKLMSFLNLNESAHINKFKFFNPNVSINNTNIWNKLKNQEPINYIYKNLKEYCYFKSE